MGVNAQQPQIKNPCGDDSQYSSSAQRREKMAKDEKTSRPTYIEEQLTSVGKRLEPNQNLQPPKTTQNPQPPKTTQTDEKSK